MIGCGWTKGGNVFFSKNGTFLGVAFRNMKYFQGNYYFFSIFFSIFFFLFLFFSSPSTLILILIFTVPAYPFFGVEEGSTASILANFGQMPFHLENPGVFVDDFAEKGETNENSQSRLSSVFICEGIRIFFERKNLL